MFGDLDLTVEKLLQKVLGDPLPFDLSFAAPTSDFKPLSMTRLTLNCFLCDVREDRDFRDNTPLRRSLPGGQIEQVPPPFRAIALYCLTVWSPAQETGDTHPARDEHTLLGQVLTALLKYPVLPSEVLRGALIGQDPLPLARVGGPDDRIRTSDFWSAVGGRLRPSLEYAVTLSLAYQDADTDPMVTTAVVRFANDGDRCTLGGIVTDMHDPPLPLAGAWIALSEVSLQVQTQPDGRFVMSGVLPGNYTLKVRATGFRESAQPILVPGPAEGYVIRLVPVA